MSSPPIISIYTDSGGEFQALKSFIKSHGISHFLNPPHTPEHNGSTEHRHRDLETGITLLNHASLPLHFRSYIFLTTIYLINGMPTPLLQLISKLEKLFGHSPNYTKLRVFRCFFFFIVWLKPYISYKFEPKSKPCVFLDYSFTQIAFKCLDPTIKRPYISGHVPFVENVFR